MKKNITLVMLVLISSMLFMSKVSAIANRIECGKAIIVVSVLDFDELNDYGVGKENNKKNPDIYESGYDNIEEYQKQLNSGTKVDRQVFRAVSGKGDKVSNFHFTVTDASTGKTCNSDWWNDALDKNEGSIQFTIESYENREAHITINANTEKRSNGEASETLTKEVDISGIVIATEKDRSEVAEENTKNETPTVTYGTTTPNNIKINGSQKLQCDSGEVSLREFINKYWKYFILLTPILLIIMITVDFVKALFASNADALKKASSDAIKRTIAAILLLALPLLLSTILSLFKIEFCM